MRFSNLKVWCTWKDEFQWSEGSKIFVSKGQWNKKELERVGTIFSEFCYTMKERNGVQSSVSKEKLGVFWGKKLY